MTKEIKTVKSTKSKRAYNNKKSRSLIEGVPHMPQEADWDCGVTCLKMSLRYLNPELKTEDFVSALERHDLATSVWTIDLAYLCSFLGIRHKFVTQTLGVDKKFANESFYTESIRCDFNEEETRVNDLFSKAHENGVSTEKGSVHVREIIHHVENNQPVIILINDRVLRKNYLKEVEQENNASFWSWLCCGFAGNSRQHPEVCTNNETNCGFWGHYVVVVGYDMKRRLFILQDPSPDGKHARCTFEALDEARKSFGTDEDILFLFSSR